MTFGDSPESENSHAFRQFGTQKEGETLASSCCPYCNMALLQINLQLISCLAVPSCVPDHRGLAFPGLAQGKTVGTPGPGTLPILLCNTPTPAEAEHKIQVVYGSKPLTQAALSVAQPANRNILHCKQPPKAAAPEKGPNGRPS